MISIRVGIITNRFGELGTRLPQRTADAIRAAVDETAQQARQRAPVDTGELRDSIQGRVINQFSGEVVATADHAIFQEYGTRFQPAQPYLTPAAEAVRPQYLAAVAKAVADLG